MDVFNIVVGIILPLIVNAQYEDECSPLTPLNISIGTVCMPDDYVFKYPVVVATWYCTLSDTSMDETHIDNFGNMSHVKTSCFPDACGTRSPPRGYGIVAVNPRMLSSTGYAPYQGCSDPGYRYPKSNICYQISGPSGSAKLMVTDRCAGYSGDPVCCGSDGAKGPDGCSSQGGCDWCAANDHAHFDMDTVSITAICGHDVFRVGHCQVTKVAPIKCG